MTTPQPQTRQKRTVSPPERSEPSHAGENPRQKPTTEGTGFAASQQLVGYARVSTADQSCERQRDELVAAGCIEVFEEVVSGVAAARPELDACMRYARTGDTIAVTELSRLGRSTREVLEVIASLEERSIGVRVLGLGLETSTPTGRLVVTILAAVAAMERELLVERTRSGLLAARARGRVGGRPRALDSSQSEHARALHADGRTPTEIGHLLGVSERTIRRRLQETA